MAIDIKNPTEANQLARAIKYSWSQGSSERTRRTRLIEIYRDERPPWESVMGPGSSGLGHGAMVNLFQQFVRGVQISLAYQAPKYSLKARKAEGVGFDAVMQQFLNSYTCILNFRELLRQFATDTCFGDAIAKTVESLAPKGIYSPLAPRTFRVNPNNFIRDRAAENVTDSLFFADVYLVALKEARAYEGFDPEVVKKLQSYTLGSDEQRSDRGFYNVEAYAEDVTRLIDIYIPATGQICTYPAPTDAFGEISTGALEIRDSPVNPYSICRMSVIPDSLAEIARLESLRELHLLTNDMWDKAARQSRQSKRNPMDVIGNENDMDSLLTAPDGEAVFVNEKTADIYVLPAADPQIVNMAGLAQQTFSQQAGNLEVALGLGAGAGTARQSNQILQQVTASTALDQSIFNEFIADIGRKLCTVAFQSEVFEYQSKLQIPGLKHSINVGWSPASKLPRVGEVDDYSFEVVPLSGALRTPQERLQQLTGATQMFAQIMMLQAQGVPLNMPAVMKSISEGFDLVPDLEQWWSPEPQPTPAQQTGQMYQSLAGPAEGSQVNYNGVDGGAQAPAAASGPSLQGGLQGGR
jgi:hypothetical protein